jgi:hypothetical protein
MPVRLLAGSELIGVRMRLALAPWLAMTASVIEVSDRDAVALVGVLAVVSGPLLAEALDDGLARRLRDWLAREGLVAADASQRALSLALEEIVQRLRHALGEPDRS